MTEQRTPWFPGEVKPARAGWYEREWNEAPKGPPKAYFDYWDGRVWSLLPEGAPSLHWWPWRGLTERAYSMRELVIY